MKKPTKTSLAKKLDIAWSRAIKKVNSDRCEVCGKEGKLNSHHIVGRKNRTLRWDVRNGACLCTTHHKLGKQSAHEDPLWFQEWLEKNRKDDLKYLNKIRNDITDWTIEDMQIRLTELEELKDDWLDSLYKI